MGEEKMFRLGIVIFVLATCFSSSYADEMAGKSSVEIESRPYDVAKIPLEHTLEKVEVKATKPAFPANMPAVVESITAKQIEESANAVTTMGAFQYLPSLHVRERYIGDRNGILVLRANSSIASAQTTVYADGLLLSNFLNNSFSTPPRWGMVSPEEIERIDVMYGPFSALYPGNSEGGVLNITTRMPNKFEAHAKYDLFTQDFKLYGADKSYSGQHGAASVGSKWNDLSFFVSLDRLDSYGQPQTFSNATRSNVAAAIPANSTTVSGGYRDLDPQGLARVITATTGIDHTVQDNAKVKLIYDFTPTIKGAYTLGVWQNDSVGTIDSYLKNVSTGQTFYNTTGSGNTQFVRFSGDPNFYKLTAIGPSQAESEHWMHGISLKSNTEGEWDWQVFASLYRQEKEITRTSVPTNAFSDGSSGAGTYKRDNGTGWKTLDLRGDWRPDGNMQSRHQVSFGYHYDRYELDSQTWNVTDWVSATAGALNTNSFGKTETQAMYVQDAWQLHPDWKLVAGGRWEDWRAFDGSNYNLSNPAAFRQLNYANRDQNNFSPKLSLSYQARSDWMLRGSFGKAYRYPTVAEMFQVISLPGNVRANDPNLKPEHVNSYDFTVEKILQNGLWRTSLFYEDKHDALISQTDTTTIPGTSISSIQNVDGIHTKGIETALQMNDVLVNGLDITGSVTYVDSEIVANHKNPFTVGKPQPRIPDWRATVVGVYHVNEKLSVSLAGRYSGNQEVNLLYNTINPDVYGTTVSKYTVFDTKLVYKASDRWTASLGINNIGDYRYYVNPNPYPQRTYFASVKFDY
jgi:iron complex outermembrane recepter protein